MRKRGTSGLLKGNCTRADCESANGQRDRGCRGVVGCGVHGTKTVVISIPSLRQSKRCWTTVAAVDQGGPGVRPAQLIFRAHDLYPSSLAAVTVHWSATTRSPVSERRTMSFRTRRMGVAIAASILVATVGLAPPASAVPIADTVTKLTKAVKISQVM